jgi:hypothetical protein
MRIEDARRAGMKIGVESDEDEVQLQLVEEVVR